MKSFRHPSRLPFLLGFCWVMTLLCSSLVADDVLPKELDSLKFEYEVMLAEINKPLESFFTNYRNRLDRIAADLQSQGDLQGVLAVRKELETLGETGDTASPAESGSKPQALLDARAIYQREKIRLTEQISEKSAPLTDAYRKRIEKLISHFTQQERLEDALATKAFLAALPEETTAPGPGPRSGGTGKKDLKIRVQIDGVSHLLLRGSEIWFDHTKGTVAPPGRHGGEHPTHLDDETEWKPVWSGKVTERFDAGIDLPVEGPPPRIHLRFNDGRGSAEVIEQPSAENDFTAKVEMRDGNKKKKGFFGSDWMEFRLKW